ncbi:exosortase system-associated protein, TIGR04073 family [Methylomonas rapida]|uniref:Exosortase system-associated protein, TIGR04073 family n=1 Tax=Methylomonas rapida TaxID=2963939 RepID=A0ABY7GLM0_9GAMM|nr:exosortase system-associated protein, TIGR04073 family [Methylomonas rapida]WAR45387.1 exosortase system-associated protein, TIGR04073 family [Methylomonas rapida]
MKHNRTLACLLLVGCLTAANPLQAEPTESYGEIVGRKLASGLGNITTAVGEIPKNIIIVNNESNFVYAFTGGMIKGLLNMTGRIGVGFLDLISAPIPTYPVIDPLFIWDDFYADTTYGPILVYEESR